MPLFRAVLVCDTGNFEFWRQALVLVFLVVVLDLLVYSLLKNNYNYIYKVLTVLKVNS